MNSEAKGFYLLLFLVKTDRKSLFSI